MITFLQSVRIVPILLRAGLMMVWVTCVSGAYARQSGQTQLPPPISNLDALPFQTSAFTFVRIQYSFPPGTAGFSAGSWATDWPEADRHFSAQIQNLTGLSTNDPVALELTDPNLGRYPFIYIVEGGRMRLSDAEVVGLRDYLLGGGFLMVDDFWGSREWASLAAEFRRVFPDREPVELPRDHEIFRSPYPIGETPMVPNVGTARSANGFGEQDATEAHFRGLFDDTGRLMVVLCHNSDFGDAWEWDESPEYPRGISLGYAVPMGINIVAYALSH